MVSFGNKIIKITKVYIAIEAMVLVIMAIELDYLVMFDTAQWQVLLKYLL